ncbi:MAG: DUF975 family protein [Oscillospiraceae bacterium]|jgi:uncharacterized membrane protein|nr:DUF975 family protein [Oscillospiraceae bacterium]
MTFDRAYLKKDAQAAMRGYKPNPIGVAAVYLVICYILQGLTLRVNHFFENYSELMSALMNGYYPFIQSPTAADQLIGIVINIAIIMLAVGFSIFCMHVSRAQKGGFEDIFGAFTTFFRYFGLAFVMGIFICLWSLLLIVPGIIAAYRYRLAIYLAIDHPDWDIMQCINESKRLMYGHKGKAFVLDLSFIGWGILTGMTWGILGIWTAPYIGITNVRFYEWVLAANGESYIPSDGAAPKNYEPVEADGSEPTSPPPELPDSAGDTDNSGEGGNNDGDSFWK